MLSDYVDLKIKRRAPEDRKTTPFSLVASIGGAPKSVTTDEGAPKSVTDSHD
jgi:hypothetical protein